MGSFAPSGKSLRRKSRLDSHKKNRSAHCGLFRRLRLEPLEDRCLLTNLVVSSSLDSLTTSGTLRYEVNQANLDAANGVSDTITFNTAAMGGSVITLQEGALELKAGAGITTISGQVRLNGDNANLFQVDNGATLVLNGLTLAGGAAPAGSNGGAINNAGTLTVEDCTFSQNSAANGGAIANTSSGSAILENDIFSSNSASGNDGGALSNNGAMTVEDCTLSGNTAGYDGGALYNDGPMTVTGCTLNGNSILSSGQGNGGALYNDASGLLTVNTSTFTDNSAFASGAISAGGATTLSACTVAGNSAVYGGGIVGYASDPPNLVDTIVAGNAASGADPDIDGAVTASSSYNLIGNGGGLTGISNGVNNNQIGSSDTPINPLLAALGNYGGSTQTMPPQADSPALDAGGSVTTLTAAIGTQTTAIPVAAAAAIASTAASYVGTIQIDGEVMSVSSVALASNTLTVVRSAQPPAASHAAGAAVYFEYDQSGHIVQPGSLAIGAEQAGLSVTQISPTTGPASGGTSVVISGSGLTGATAVDFGTTPAGSFSYNADSGQITAISPVGTGTVNVTVTTPQGTSATSSADQFTYTSTVNPLIVTSADDPATPTLGTLRYAVNQANADAANGISDTITFDTVQMGTSSITLLQGDLELLPGSGTTTIDGGGLVEISGGGSSSGVFVVDSGAQAVLTGLTIDNGQAATGGGVDNAGTLTISNTAIANNNALNTDAPLPETASPSSQPLPAAAANNATDTGGIALGGGIYNTGLALLTDVTISGNSAVNTDAGDTAYGGGIDNTGSATLTDCTISNNTAGDPSTAGNGGGIDSMGTLIVTDCTFSGNNACLLVQSPTSSSGGWGGAILNTGSAALTATTVCGNVADSGGGISNYAPGTLTLADAIVAANTLNPTTGTGPDVLGGVAATSAYNLIGIGVAGLGIATGSQGNQVGTPAVPLSPLLAPLGSYGGDTQTMALLPGSPAAGSGEAIAGITTDERGEPLSSPPSIGAYQPAQAASIAVSAPATATADTPFTVTVTATDADGNPLADGEVLTLAGSDGHAISPATISLADGTWTGAVTLHYPGSVTLIASDGAIKGTSSAISVSPAAPTSFTVDAPTPEKAGAPFTVTVTAVDAGGQTPMGYTGPFALAVAGKNAQAVLGLSNSNSLAMTNGTWTGSIYLKTVASGVVLTASAGAGATAVTGQSAPIDVQSPRKADIVTLAKPWYLLNIRDVFIQQLAYADFESNSPKSITFDNMVGLFAEAETLVSNGDTGALLSLQDLVSNFSNSYVNMPADVAYLANQVLNPSASDLALLEQYYIGPNLVWNVSVAATSPKDFGGFVLTIYKSYEQGKIQRQVRTATLDDSDSVADVQSALNALSVQATSHSSAALSALGVDGNLYTSVHVYTGGGPGDFSITFDSPYILDLSARAVDHSEVFLSVSTQTDPSEMPVPVYLDDGTPTFGYSGAPAGVALAAETKALVNQWFLATVHPDAQPVCPYGTPPGPLSLYGPTGGPVATDVQQTSGPDCGFLSALADVAYNDPAAIESMITDNENGTYTIRFYDSPANYDGASMIRGDVQYVTVDAELPETVGYASEYGSCANPYPVFGNPVQYDDPYVGSNTVLWAALVEKAYAEVYLQGYSLQDLKGMSQAYTLTALTGLPTGGNAVSSTEMATAFQQGQLVCAGTAGVTPSKPLVGGHAYAVLAYDSSSDQFLFDNPWGSNAATTLAVGINKSTSSVQVVNAGSIVKGDIIQIDDELMLVTKPPQADTKDNYYTLTVTRGYDKSTPSPHLATATSPKGGLVGATEVYLELIKGAPWTQLSAANGSPVWARGQGPSVNGSIPAGGLFGLSAAFIDLKDAKGNLVNVTNETQTTTAPSAAAPMASLSTGGAATISAANGSSSFPGAGLSASNLFGTPLTQATTLDQPQAAPLQVAAAIPLNRPEAVDAIFAASGAAGQQQAASPQGSNLFSDDADALFAADGLALWGVKLTELGTAEVKAAIVTTAKLG